LTEINAGDDYALIKDSQIIVFTAGVARKEGMTRLDLLKINAKVAKEVSQKIKEFSPQAIVIVITNPLDIITYVVTKETGFMRNRILGMGSTLDTARLLNILNKISGFNLNKIEGMVFGLHNNDMIISANRIKIKGKLPDIFLKNDEFKKIQEMTALRGGQIVGYLKNKSAHFAPALSACRLVEAITGDEKNIMPVSVLLEGEYELSNVCVGVPCLIGKNGIHKIIELKLTNEESNKLRKVQEEFTVLKEIII
jgi:malate dehydrogenase